MVFEALNKFPTNGTSKDTMDSPSSPESPHSNSSHDVPQAEGSALSDHSDAANHPTENNHQYDDSSNKTSESFESGDRKEQNHDSNSSSKQLNQSASKKLCTKNEKNTSNGESTKSNLLGNSNDSNSSMSVEMTKNLNNCNNSNESTAKSDSSESDQSETGEDGTSVVYEIQSESECDEDDPKAVPLNDEESDVIDSGEESEEGSGPSEGEIDEMMGQDDLVSINSDSEAEPMRDESHTNANDSTEILLIDDLSNHAESKNEKQKNGTRSPVVHEIVSDNDDCVLSENKSTDGKTLDNQNMLKNTRSKNKVSLNDKAIDLAVKQRGKSLLLPSKKKEPSVVIIDTKTLLSAKPKILNKPTLPAGFPSQSLYQSIAACGTTVTPVSTKPTPLPVATSHTILPSLSDDMFVVEAPSFIVPYVYEKPSVKPFREFVDILGKDLEKIREKEEQERLKEEEANKSTKNAVDLPSEGAAENAEVTAETKKLDISNEAASEETQQKKKDKKGRKKLNDDDDASWDGESSSDSDDELMSDDDTPKTVIIKEKEDDPLVDTKNTSVTDLIVKSKPGVKSDSYFENSLGVFFIDIGINLVQEYVQSDLVKQQKRKLYKENKMGIGNPKATEMSISALMKNLEFSKENNAPYKHKQKKCEYCSFKTESAIALAHHMETPHMKNNLYKCNFCSFEVKSPHEILFHMEAEHNVRGRLERAPAYHMCANCPFEDNSKGKLARHLVACAKKFKPDHNLTPPVEWEPPAKIIKMTHGRNMMNPYQTAYSKSQAGVPGLPHTGMQSYRGRGRPQMSASGQPVHGAPLVRGGVMFRSHAPKQVLIPSNFQLLGGQTTIKPNVPNHRPTLSITPLSRTPQPPPLAPLAAAAASASATNSGKSTFVICEICDGYIKDLEQLGNHMLWIHKVKIHPKMIHNRPPLNCQKCQFRFFTDQGLERHLLGSHGLVTSSMQEAANKAKDAGRCPVCGKVYQWKLLYHVAKDHNMTLKPAHLSYKCTVCTATFGMYKQFENHVYSAHSVTARKVTDKKATSDASTVSAGSSKSSVVKKTL